MALTSLDAFQQVINCNWDGTWIVVSIDGGVPTTITGLIQVLDGTIGNDIDLASSTFSNFPHSISAADIATKVKNSNGIPYFGIRNINPSPQSPLQNQLAASDANVNITGYSNATQVFFKYPKSQGPLRFDVNANFSATLGGLSYIAAWPIKPFAPQNAPIKLPAPYPSTKQSSIIVSSTGSIRSEFIVDLKALTITGQQIS